MSEPMPTIPTQSPFTYPNPNSSASPSHTQDDTFMPNPSVHLHLTQDDTFMLNLKDQYAHFHHYDEHRDIWDAFKASLCVESCSATHSILLSLELTTACSGIKALLIPEQQHIFHQFLPRLLVVLITLISWNGRKDIKWQMAMPLRINMLKVTEVKTDQPKALSSLSVDSRVKLWSGSCSRKHDWIKCERKYGKMAGLHAD
ncbi:hypothetical protein Tco_0038895 [Tanacetum coccineum]